MTGITRFVVRVDGFRKTRRAADEGFVLGLILGVLLLPVGGMLYFHFGHPPVAVADTAFPMEEQIVHVPLHARIDEEAPKSAPIEPSAVNLQAGA